MLRLAEVYLNLAEAILGNNASTTDATALYYFNEVRKRAGLNAKTSLTYEDLRHERRMELAFEGQYWYDLVRRAYYKQQEVVNYVNNQNRNASYYDSSTHEYKLSEDYVAPGKGVATATEKNLLLPTLTPTRTATRISRATPTATYRPFLMSSESVRFQKKACSTKIISKTK